MHNLHGYIESLVAFFPIYFSRFPPSLAWEFDVPVLDPHNTME